MQHADAIRHRYPPEPPWRARAQAEHQAIGVVLARAAPPTHRRHPRPAASQFRRPGSAPAASVSAMPFARAACRAAASARRRRAPQSSRPRASAPAAPRCRTSRSSSGVPADAAPACARARAIPHRSSACAGSRASAASTRSAARRNASSRSAIRLPLRKKFSRARAAASADRPCRPPDASAVRRPAGRPPPRRRRRSNTGSGTVSAHADAGDAPTTSLRLSRCCTLSVVQTSMPASSNSSTSCQRLRWRPPSTLRVGQFVDGDQRGMRGQRGIEIEFLEHAPAILGTGAAAAAAGLPAARAVSPRPCVSATPTRTVVPSACNWLQRLQHGVGLADAGAGAEKDLQLAARRPLLAGRDFGEQPIGIGARRAHRRGLCAAAALAASSSARFSASTLTRGSPNSPSDGACICAAISASHLPSDSPRALRHARRLPIAPPAERCPDPARWPRPSPVRPASVALAHQDRPRAATAMRCFTASTSAGLLGPRLLPVEASALYGIGEVADGRPRKYFGASKFWPISRAADRLAVAHDQAAVGLLRGRPAAPPRWSPADKRCR